MPYFASWSIGLERGFAPKCAALSYLFYSKEKPGFFKNAPCTEVDGLAAANYNPLCMILTELDVLRDVSQRLTSGGVAFMLTGSMAMNYYAQPRMTRDIDLVVELASEQIELLISMFETEYYVDRHAVARAIAERSMFNLIHNETIIKLDCIVLKK